MEYQFASLGPTLRIVVLFFLIAFAILASGGYHCRLAWSNRKIA